MVVCEEVAFDLLDLMLPSRKPMWFTRVALVSCAENACMPCIR